MTDNCMTPETCREHQRECAAAMHAELATLRSQMAADIALIRAAVQDIDRAVARIKGYLGINGEGTPHPHKRDNERDEHLHRRLTDLTDAMNDLGRRSTDAPADWRVKVMWGVGIFLISTIVAPVLYAIGGYIAKRLFG